MGGPRLVRQPEAADDHGLWSLAAGLLAALGLVGGVMTWGLTGVLVSCLSMSMACWCLVALGDLARPAHPVRTSAAYGTGVTGVLGLLAVGGLGGVLLVVLLVATAPHVRWLRRWWDDGRSPVGSPGMTPAVRSLGAHEAVAAGELPGAAVISAGSLPPADVLAGLDDAQLCLAWRRSFLPLTACDDAAAQLRIVRLRQTYLDELTRRHPAEMARWLDSGARAAGNPMRFLRGEDDGPSPERP